MINNKIKIDVRSAIIIALSIVVLVVGAYFYRDSRTVEQQKMVVNTQELILNLQLSPAVAIMFKQLGWEVIYLDPTPQNVGEIETGGLE